MNSIALLERVREAQPAGPCIVTPDRAFDVAELAARTRCLPLGEGQASGAVALYLARPVHLAIALLALDGRAQRILLLSPDVPAADRAKLLDLFGPDAVLTDMDCDHPRAVFWPLKARGEGAPLPPARETLWTLATSGTTATPKLVEHSLASLVRRIRGPSQGRAPLRWGQLYDSCRFAGVQVLLQGLLGGGGLVLPSHGMALEEKLALFAAAGCTALSATPTLWRKILMTSAPPLALRQVTLGGEIADQMILSQLSRAYPDARICHIYASTEAGAGFSVTDGLAGFPASFLDRPQGGIAIRIRDGELQIRNPHVVGRYLGERGGFVTEDGFIRTGDMVEQVGERLEFRGRRSGIINVGGNKLYPEEVERILLAHDMVAQARVYGRPSPITGQLVAASIVTRPSCPDQRALIADLKAHCRSTLRPWQVPTAIAIVPDLDMGASGKLARDAA